MYNMHRVPTIPGYMSDASTTLTNISDDGQVGVEYYNHGDHPSAKKISQNEDL